MQSLYKYILLFSQCSSWTLCIYINEYTNIRNVLRVHIIVCVESNIQTNEKYNLKKKRL